MSRRTHSVKKRDKRCRRKRGQQRRSRVPNKSALARLQKWLLPTAEIFAKLRLHGNTSWTFPSLVWLALSWSWSQCKLLTDAFAEAVEACDKMICGSPLTSYTGFMGALTRWTAPAIDGLCSVMQARMQEIGGRFWQVGKWVPIAFDGSRNTAPRTRANEQSFCASNYGKGTTARYRKKKTKGMRRRQNQQNKPQPQEPQTWVTLLWHMRLRLPWMWRLGPSNSSEREHVAQMLDTGSFPKNTLFCGDAGFVGYPLWSRIMNRGYQFMVRVGANVSLLHESAQYTLEENGEVLCWPKEMIRAQQPPLRLRLVQVLIGRTKVWILTSVLREADLGLPQIVKLYKMRWGIEVEFRGLKQTLDRARLRSRNDRRLLVELDWSIMAMAVVELWALKEQLSQTGHRIDKRSIDPIKRSLAQAVRALRKCLRHLDDIPKPGHDLPTLLRAAVTDSYTRTSSKKSRHRPSNPDKKPLGDPKLRSCTPQEKAKLDALTTEQNAA